MQNQWLPASALAQQPMQIIRCRPHVANVIASVHVVDLPGRKIVLTNDNLRSMMKVAGRGSFIQPWAQSRVWSLQATCHGLDACRLIMLCQEKWSIGPLRARRQVMHYSQLLRAHFSWWPGLHLGTVWMGQ